MFTKPEGWTDEQCVGLPAYVQQWKNEKGEDERIVISCWQLTEEEREQIATTGKLWMSVYGETVPPIALMTTEPFE